MGESEFRVDLGGYRLLVSSAGSGPPLLLLHGGLGSGKSHFSRQIPAFAPGFRVLAPDFRGYGGSDPRPRFGPDFYQEDARDAAALIRALGLGPVHVCGFSDGGIVALLLAINAPEQVRSLTVIAGQAYVDRPTMDGVAAWWPPERMPEAVQVALARLHGAERWRRLVADYVEGFRALYERGGDICRERLGEIGCPTLLFHGEADPYLGMEHPLMLRDGIPGAELVLYPDTGHFVQKEQAEDLNRRVLRFLAGV